jgi:hypothetical protein
MLDGIDPDWNRAGTRHTATYTNLPHGRRVLRVRASNNDGVWSAEDATLLLTIKPRFHQTVFFWGFLLIIVAGLSYGAYHLRVAALKTRERDLARRVDESTRGLHEERDLRREVQERLHRDLEHLRESDRAVDVTAQRMTRIDEAVSQTAEKMRLAGQSSERIFEIIDLMEEIANRSELLSLNAAIEAAHAGEAGRGFNVVAEEIHRLAERSTEATKDVNAIVKGMADETHAALSAMQNSMREVKEGLQLSEQARRELHQISGLVQRAVDLANQISSAARELTTASQTVNQAMQTISNISEESWAGANETARAVRDLVALSEHLTKDISRFRVDRPVDEKGALLSPEERVRVAKGLVDLLAELSHAAASFDGAATASQDARSSLTEEQTAATMRINSVARQIAGALADLGVLRRDDAKLNITEKT